MWILSNVSKEDPTSLTQSFCIIITYPPLQRGEAAEGAFNPPSLLWELRWTSGQVAVDLRAKVMV